MAARAIDGGLISEQSCDSGVVMDAGFANRARSYNEAIADLDELDE
jgi:hypothetical protein